jgi:hypothetical protein
VSRYTKVLELLEEGSLKIETESMEKGILLNKTEDKYHDRELYWLLEDMCLSLDQGGGYEYGWGRDYRDRGKAKLGRIE